MRREVFQSDIALSRWRSMTSPNCIVYSLVVICVGASAEAVSLLINDVAVDFDAVPESATEVTLLLGPRVGAIGRETLGPLRRRCGPQLTRLTLSVTNGDLTAAGIFTGLPSLKHLHILSSDGDSSSSSLSTFRVSLSNVTFDGLDQLVALHLGQNRLHAIAPGLISRCRNLSYLALGKNLIADTADVHLEGLDLLMGHLKVDLYGNNITRLRRGGFNVVHGKSGFQSVVDLNLGQNQIAFIESGAFSGLNMLHKLYLDKNQIRDIAADVFHDLPALDKLTLLDLSGNQLEVIHSGSFSSLTGLRRLYLSSNRIGTVESHAFRGLSRLRELELGGNVIRSVDVNTFAGLSSLVELRLARNFITVIAPTSFRHFAATLQTVQLNDNQLETFAPETFNDLINLTSNGATDLTGNPWRCDCSLQDAALNLSSIVADALLRRHTSAVCRSPAELANHTLAEVLLDIHGSPLQCRLPSPGPPLIDVGSTERPMPRPRWDPQSVIVLTVVVALVAGFVLIVCWGVFFVARRTRVYFLLSGPVVDGLVVEHQGGIDTTCSGSNTSGSNSSSLKSTPTDNNSNFSSQTYSIKFTEYECSVVTDIMIDQRDENIQYLHNP